MRHTIGIERAPFQRDAYVPDVPGCVAIAASGRSIVDKGDREAPRLTRVE